MVRNVVRGLSLAVLLTAAVTAYPHTADSQAVVNCAERSQVIELLTRQYEEKQAAVGQINPQAVMELYAADGGSWTLIVTDVSGRSCVIFCRKKLGAGRPGRPEGLTASLLREARRGKPVQLPSAGQSMRRCVAGQSGLPMLA